ncbi:mCG1027416 [Mus musculus]|uniref:Gm833 protein n=1 Tax=Mus musculus TaxID=10090 RepID=Q3V423_MOUSE|nr:Gm833 protein [Mus musculus]AAI47048.1 Gm833 protein [Mus musculus]EDL14945.1 mCG1027416 [Mus musculus]BAE20431.1 unnamed protein product [Mus musculus]
MLGLLLPYLPARTALIILDLTGHQLTLVSAAAGAARRGMGAGAWTLSHLCTPVSGIPHPDSVLHPEWKPAGVLRAAPALTFSWRRMQCGGRPRLATVSDGKGDPEVSLSPSLSPS